MIVEGQAGRNFLKFGCNNAGSRYGAGIDNVEAYPFSFNYLGTPVSQNDQRSNIRDGKSGYQTG